MKRFFLLMLSLAAAGLFYSNIYNNEFIFDDHDIIVNNKAIRDITDLRTVLTTNYWHEQANAGLYRPMIFLLYAVDYAFWGTNPTGYHITNVVFHLLTCILLFGIVSYFSKDLLVQGLAVLMFAIHPVHAEAVTGVVGRAEVVGTCFFCLSWVLFLIRYCTGRGGIVSLSIVGSWVAYFLALASKENMFVLPVVLFLSMLFFDRKFYWKKTFFFLLPYAIVFIIYMTLRFSVIASIGPQGTERFFHDTAPFAIFLTMLRVFAFYWKLLLIPTDLLASYRHWQVSKSLFDWRVLLSIPIVAGWLFSAVLFFRQKKLWQFCLIFMLVALFSVSNIIPIGDIMAERFLYLPSIGFSIIFALVLLALIRHARRYISFKWGVVYLLIVTLFFGVDLMVRNAQWRDGILFWKTTLKDIPDSYSAYTNLAFSYTDKKMYSHAIAAVNRSLALNPNAYVSQKLRARLLYDTGKYDEAMKQASTMIKTDATQYAGYDYMALSLMRAGKAEQAISICERGISVVNNKQPLYYTLIRIFLNMGDARKAYATANQAIHNSSADPQAYIRAGECSDKLADPNQAIQYYRKALALDRFNLEALDKLAMLCFKQEQYDRALHYWLRAVKKYPEKQYFWYYIGLAYEKQGAVSMAISSWNKVAQLPEFKDRVFKKIQPYTH